jgi:NAD(P)-dependent dehydrogenase (short-subunit alcohol dehydrogenase family)
MTPSFRALLPRESVLPHGAAVVTGAAGGIGAAVARAFARADWDVLLVDVDDMRLESSVADCATAGNGHILGQHCDVSSEESVDALVATAQHTFGVIDVVVNNAGLVHVDRFLDTPLETWRRVLRVNVDGAFLCTQRFGRLLATQPTGGLLGRRGLILNMSSGAAERGRPALPAYGASKAAMNHLSSTAAIVLGPMGVAVTVLYPGSIKDGMWSHLGPKIAAAEGRTLAEVEDERTFQPVDEFAEIVLDVVALPGFEAHDRIFEWTRVSKPLLGNEVAL